MKTQNKEKYPVLKRTFLESIEKSRFLFALLVLAIFYLLNYPATDLVRLFFPDVTGYPRWGGRMVVETVGCFW